MLMNTGSSGALFNISYGRIASLHNKTAISREVPVNVSKPPVIARSQGIMRDVKMPADLYFWFQMDSPIIASLVSAHNGERLALSGVSNVYQVSTPRSIRVWAIREQRKRAMGTPR
jgi:hypothetical protein